jgi:hypothetical protein
VCVLSYPSEGGALAGGSPEKDRIALHFPQDRFTLIEESVWVRSAYCPVSCPFVCSVGKANSFARRSENSVWATGGMEMKLSEVVRRAE